VDRVISDVGADGGQLEQPAALLRLAAARVVDDEAPHDTGGIAHEPRAIGEGDAFASRDVEVGLVQEGRRSEGEGTAVLGELPLRQPVELGVESGEQAVGRRTITALDRAHELLNRRCHAPPQVHREYTLIPGTAPPRPALAPLGAARPPTVRAWGRAPSRGRSRAARRAAYPRPRAAPDGRCWRQPGTRRPD